MKKLPPHIGKIAAAVVAAAAPLIYKAVSDAIHKRMAADKKPSSAKKRAPRKRKRPSAKRQTTDGVS